MRTLAVYVAVTDGYPTLVGVLMTKLASIECRVPVLFLGAGDISGLARTRPVGFLQLCTADIQRPPRTEGTFPQFRRQTIGTPAFLERVRHGLAQHFRRALGKVFDESAGTISRIMCRAHVD